MSYKYKIGDIVKFSHFIEVNNQGIFMRTSKLITETGFIFKKSDLPTYHWIAKGFTTNEFIHLKEEWITKLN